MDKKKQSYVQAMEQLKRDIFGDGVAYKPDLKHPKIIVIPEIYTFNAERTFYSIGKGAFDVRVCSMTKLYSEWCGKDKAIGRQGAVALIRKILIDSKNQLKYYKQSYDKRGFAGRMYEIIEKLNANGVDADSLTSNQNTEEDKFSDISLIYKRYLQETAGKFVDSTGRINALTEFVRKNPEKVANMDFYLVNFDVLTKAQKDFAHALTDCARGVRRYRSEMIEGYAMPKNTKIFSASSAVSQLKRVACTINSLVNGDDKQKTRYDQICILGEDINYNTLKRIMDENNVPFYFDKRKSLMEHEVGRFVIATARAFAENLRRERMIALARSPYALSFEQRDAFIAYVRIFMPNFAAFRAPFEKVSYGDWALTATAEQARARLLSIIDKIALPDTAKVQDFTDAIKAVLGVIGDEAGKEKENNSVRPSEGDYAQESKRMKQLAVNSIGLLSKVLGDGEYSLSHLIDIVEEEFMGASISVIPDKSNTVFVGPINARRGFSCKHLFIVNFNDGVLPKQSNMPDLIGEEAAARLKLKPLMQEMNDRYFDEVMQATRLAENLHLSYVSGGGMKKSYLLEIIQRINGISEELESDFEALVEQKISEGDHSYLGWFISTESSCLEYALTGKNAWLKEAASRLVEDKIKGIDSQKQECDKLETEVELESTSVSALQDYFYCPRKHYFKYLLGINASTDGNVKSNDVGDMLHKVLEMFINRRFIDENAREVEWTKERTLALAQSVTDEALSKSVKSDIEENSRIINIIRQDAIGLCLTAEAQLLGGSFSAYKSEMKVENLTLNAGGKTVSVHGKIDRVDVSGNMLRIIDYKTGKTNSIDLKDLYYGTNIQLPIYASAIENMKIGENSPRCVGMLYFGASASSDGRLSGCAMDSKDVLCAMDSGVSGVIDRTDEFEFESEIFNYKIRNKYKKQENVIERTVAGIATDEEQLRSYVNYALAVAEQAATEIIGGNVTASPRGTDNYTSCSKCDYAYICKKDDRTNKLREQDGKVDENTIMEAVK